MSKTNAAVLKEYLAYNNNIKPGKYKGNASDAQARWVNDIKEVAGSEWQGWQEVEKIIAVTIFK